MNVRGLELLLEPAGWELLEALPPYDPDSALVLGEALRAQGLDADLVAAAMTQSRLRAKAEGKFGPFAKAMLFTADGLAQATRLPVAAHHAGRYRTAGCHTVADLTCGIGGDALALAGLGLEVVAAEIDEVTCAIATVNLRVFPTAQVENTDGLTLDLTKVDAVFADPARRTGAGRVFDPAAYRPPLDQVLALADRLPVGVKVGPGIAHSALPAGWEAQWVSVEGDVVECGLWSGPLRSPHAAQLLEQDGPGVPEVARTALVMQGDHAHHLSDDGARPAPVRALGDYLYEPDGAVIRAGLVGSVAATIDAGLLSPRIAYLTADDLSATPFARAYQVVDSFPFSVKTLRTYLRERGVGAVEIKKRGTAVTPEQLRPKLDLRGCEQATIVLTRLGERHSVIVVEPLSPVS